MAQQQGNWSLIIKPKTKWWDLKLNEIWDYRDLILIFVRRDIVAVYKQTVLGPLWFFISPVFTVLIYTFVFGSIANIPTDGIPGPLFYLSGTILWNYFNTSFSTSANTFIANAGIFGKVYFPRMVSPISSVLSNMFKFFIQMLMLISLLVYYSFFTDADVHISKYIVLFPVLVLMMAGLALGVGILVSSMTTKYRDLKNFIGFGLMLLMYASPVIYPVSAVPGAYRWFVNYNPITPIIETFRLAFTGSGTFDLPHFLYSGGFIIVILVIGMMVFHRVERTFMDTV